MHVLHLKNTLITLVNHYKLLALQNVYVFFQNICLIIRFKCLKVAHVKMIPDYCDSVWNRPDIFRYKKITKNKNVSRNLYLVRNGRVKC